jgi:hypothetical protein
MVVGRWRLLGPCFAVIGLVALSAAGPAPSAPGPQQPGRSGVHVRFLPNPQGAGVKLDGVARYGNKVAFGTTLRSDPNQFAIYLGSVLGSWRPREVHRSSPGSQSSGVRLSSRWLVWLDDTFTAGSWTLVAQDLRTGRRYAVDSSRRDGPPASPSDFPVASLDGSTVAWNYTGCLKDCKTPHPTLRSYIAIRTLPNGRIRDLASVAEPCAYLWPWLSARYAVWFEEGRAAPCKGDNVVLYDRRARKQRMLTTDGQGSEPSTNGEYVAWKQGGTRFDNGEIDLLNLRTGRTSVVSKVLGRWYPGCVIGPHNSNDKCSGGNGPILTSGFAVWPSYGDWGAFGSTIVALNLRAGTERPITANSQYWDGDLPGPSDGGQIVWQEIHVSNPSGGYYDYGIGVATLPAM